MIPIRPAPAPPNALDPPAEAVPATSRSILATAGSPPMPSPAPVRLPVVGFDADAGLGTVARSAVPSMATVVVRADGSQPAPPSPPVSSIPAVTASVIPSVPAPDTGLVGAPPPERNAVVLVPSGLVSAESLRQTQTTASASGPSPAQPLVRPPPATQLVSTANGANMGNPGQLAAAPPVTPAFLTLKSVDVKSDPVQPAPPGTMSIPIPAWGQRFPITPPPHVRPMWSSLPGRTVAVLAPTGGVASPPMPTVGVGSSPSTVRIPASNPPPQFANHHVAGQRGMQPVSPNQDADPTGPSAAAHLTLAAATPARAIARSAVAAVQHPPMTDVTVSTGVAIPAPANAHLGSNVGTVIGEGLSTARLPDAQRAARVTAPTAARGVQLPVHPADAAAAAARGTVVSRFVQERRRLMEALESAQRQVPDRRDSCPPKLVPLDGYRDARIHPKHPSAERQDSLIFISDENGLGVPLGVKTLTDLDSAGSLRAAATDAAALTTLQVPMRGLIPRTVPVGSTGIAAECRARTFVTEFISGQTLTRVKLIHNPDERLRAAASATAEVLYIIERLHATGIVHGDIRMDNFIYTGSKDMRETLKLFGFERADPFVDIAGIHLPPAQTTSDRNEGDQPLDVIPLSPWEIDGTSRKSRRDDVFRVAEMALKLAGLDRRFEKWVERNIRAGSAMMSQGNGGPAAAADEYGRFRNAIAALKRHRRFYSGVPPLFLGFYEYAVGLAFAEEPEYGQWREFFTTYAHTLRGAPGPSPSNHAQSAHVRPAPLLGNTVLMDSPARANVPLPATIPVKLATVSGTQEVGSRVVGGMSRSSWVSVVDASGGVPVAAPLPAINAPPVDMRMGSDVAPPREDPLTPIDTAGSHSPDSMREISVVVSRSYDPNPASSRSPVATNVDDTTSSTDSRPALILSPAQTSTPVVESGAISPVLVESPAAPAGRVSAGAGSPQHADPDGIGMDPGAVPPVHPPPSQPANAGAGAGAPAGAPALPGVPVVADNGETGGLFLRQRTRLERESARSRPSDATCPPAVIWLSDGGEARVNTQLGHGTGRSVFRATRNADNSPLVVKTSSTLDNANLRRELAADAAFLWVADARMNPGSFPRVFPISTRDISDNCRTRTIVTEDLGTLTLTNVVQIRDPELRLKATAAAVAKALFLIEKVHAAGIVHGNLNMGTFVYSDPANLFASLKLIDFRRSDVFVDATGRHVSQQRSKYDPTWFADLLSPWENEGSRISRRDDVFRIAEMALNMAGFDGGFTASVETTKAEWVTELGRRSFDREVNKDVGFREDIAKLKCKRTIIPASDVSGLFHAFYKTTLSLRFDSTIDYHTWIAAFYQFALTGLVHIPEVDVASKADSASAVPIAGAAMPTIVEGLLPGVGDRVVEFAKARVRQLSAATRILTSGPPSRDVCPPLEVRIDQSGAELVLRLPSHPKATGSSTRVFVTPSQPVVKILDEVDAPELIDGLAREKAFGVMMRRVAWTPLVPTVYDIVPGGGVSEHCRMRTLVAENAGSSTLLSTLVTQSEAAAIIARAIEIIKGVHSLGFVHGDVHMANYIYEKRSNIPGTLRLIDFGRTEPYVDAFGVHVPNVCANYDRSFTASLLSPGELDGHRLSRRDDLFRIAQISVYLGQLFHAYNKRLKELKEAAIQELKQLGRDKDPVSSHVAYREELSKLKKDLMLPANRPANTPPVFADFYQYTVNLRFEENPDYDQWIQRFKEFAAAPAPAVPAGPNPVVPVPIVAPPAPLITDIHVQTVVQAASGAIPSQPKGDQRPEGTQTGGVAPPQLAPAVSGGDVQAQEGSNASR